MAEDQTPDAGEALPSEKPPTPGMRILGQFVRDISFENPRAPDSLRSEGPPPKIEMQIELNAKNRADGLFEVDLKLTCSATREQDIVFFVEVVYGGLFAIDNVPPEDMEAALLIECPRYLFPFARRIIADLTAEGGFAPLRMDPIDFGGIYMARKAQAEQQALEAGQSET